MREYKYALAGLLVSFVACSAKKDTNNEPLVEVMTASGSNEQSATILIRVDGALVTSIHPGDITKRQPLHSLLPTTDKDETRWHSIVATADSRTLKIALSQYPQASVDLYPEGNTIAIGLFLPIPPNAKPHVQRRLTEPHLSLKSVESIELNSHAPETAKSVAYQTLQLVHDGKAVAELNAETFSKLPVGVSFVERRNPERRAKEQYQLADVLAPYIEQERILGLTLHAANRSIDIDPAALVARDQRLLLKRNRRGIWLYRSYKKNTPGVQEELRGIIRVEFRSAIKP